MVCVCTNTLHPILTSLWDRNNYYITIDQYARAQGDGQSRRQKQNWNLRFLAPKSIHPCPRFEAYCIEACSTTQLVSSLSSNPFCFLKSFIVLTFRLWHIWLKCNQKNLVPTSFFPSSASCGVSLLLKARHLISMPDTMLLWKQGRELWWLRGTDTKTMQSRPRTRSSCPPWGVWGAPHKGLRPRASEEEVTTLNLIFTCFPSSWFSFSCFTPVERQGHRKQDPVPSVVSEMWLFS